MSDFICDMCQTNAFPQSPTWEEFCIPCCITLLESDIEQNRKAMNDAR